MKAKLPVIATIKDGVALALVNYISILLAVVLYVLTCWIPYLNVGTTIAICSIPAEMAKGNVLNPTFIFDGKFRRNMGEFFILMALMFGAIAIGYLFGIIPGIVIDYAWCLAIILFVDKDMNALDALHESNRLTYGNKARIFGIEIVLSIFIIIATGIISLIFNIGDVAWLQVIGAIINVLLVLFIVPAFLGVDAVIYKKLALDEDEPVADNAPVKENKEAPAAKEEEVPVEEVK